jgi:hypothetical protein
MKQVMMHYVVLEKGKESYLFFFWPDRLMDLIIHLYECAANPQLSFTLQEAEALESVARRSVEEMDSGACKLNTDTGSISDMLSVKGPLSALTEWLDKHAGGNLWKWKKS